MSLDKKLADIFGLFQDKEKNVVDISEIPTLIRALGLVPSEVEMKKAVTAMVGEESENAVHLAAFLTVAKRLVLDRRFPPGSKAELQRALEVLATEGRKILEEEDADQNTPSGALSYGDPNKKYYSKGSLSRADLVRLLALDGERLTQDEADELMVSLPLQDHDYVNLDLYSSQLLPTQQNI